MSKRLHKQELIDAVKSQIADKRPDIAITKADVEAVADALWEIIRNELAEGSVGQLRVSLQLLKETNVDTVNIHGAI